MSILTPGRAEFYDSSPLLTPEQAQKRFADWFSGQNILSGMVAVGHIVPSRADEALLKIIQTSTNDHHSMGSIALSHQSTLEALQQDFLRIVQHDMSRVSVATQDRVSMEIGSDNLEIPWHADMGSFVRWNMSIGQAGTEGAKGQVCTADFDNNRLETMLEEGTLIVEDFPPGTVLRFMEGDIHRSPEEGATNRIFISNTVLSADYQA